MTQSHLHGNLPDQTRVCRNLFACICLACYYNKMGNDDADDSGDDKHIGGNKIEWTSLEYPCVFN